MKTYKNNILLLLLGIALLLSGCGSSNGQSAAIAPNQALESKETNLTEQNSTVLPTQYTVIVDAGSSGSRIYLYSYQDGNITSINQLCYYKIKPGISSYANNPTDAGESIATLLNNLQTCMSDKNITTNAPINFYLFATAGMRLLTNSTQNAIYTDINESIDGFSFINPVQVETIVGAQEGLYDWLAANYLQNSFASCQNPTYGVVDAGGASTQIAYIAEINNTATYKQNINGCNYNIISLSFLGLGRDQARAAMNGLEGGHNNVCYPTGYTKDGYNGNFVYPSCYSAYQEVSSAFNIKSNMSLMPENLSFVGVSTVYDVANFLNLTNNNFNNLNLISSIYQTCYQSYATLKTMYPNMGGTDLSQSCANAVYINDLLYSQNSYNLARHKVIPSDTINGISFSWTIGAMVELATYGTIIQ